MTEKAKKVPVRFFQTQSDAEPVREWLKSLPQVDRRKIGFGLMELEYGWPIGMPLCKALGSGLFELRVPLKHRIARVIFCFREGYLVALHGFIKKTRRTPAKDLAVARARKRTLERTR